MKILCPVDFTRPSDEAALASHAITLACGGVLELVHLPEQASRFLHKIVDPDLQQTIIKGASVRLEERARRFASDGAACTWQLLPKAEGQSITQALAAHASAAGVDLVVISTHGKSGSRLWPMGSLAASIVEATATPVLVIHSAKPFLAWKKGEGDSLRVFAGLDLTEESGQVLDAIRRFHFDRGSKIITGFAQQLQPTADPLMMPNAFYSLPFAEDESILEKRLQSLVTKHLKDTPAEVKVQTGFSSTAHSLVEMATSAESDLVVVGTHQRHGLSRLLGGSVSRGVLRETSASVLCVPLQPTPVGLESPPPSPKPPQEAAISCAIDFSRHSYEAALVAQTLALRFGLPFEITHIVEGSHTWPSSPDNTTETIDAGALARLGHLAEPLALRGLSPSKIILHPEMGDSIAQCFIHHLAATQPMLAVISSHGKSGAPWWPLGSTAVKIIQESVVPVLITSASAPFQRWNNKEGKLRVLGAVDATGGNPGVLEWMKKLGDAGSCAFTLTHIDQSRPNPVYLNPVGLAMPPLPGADINVLEEGLRTLAHKVLGENADTSIVVKPGWASLSDEILQVSHDVSADIIIIGAHQWHGIDRLFFESVYRKLVGQNGTSLLCLPVHTA